MAPPSGEATVEAEATRETNGCGTEWRSGSEDVGDTVGGVRCRRKGWEGCLVRGGEHVCGGQGLCQGLREAMARKEGDRLCPQMYSGPWRQEGRELGSRKSD